MPKILSQIQIIQPLFKYQNESSQNKFEWIHLFYSYKLRSPNSLDDYTVMLIEGDEFKCVFNWAHVDKKLYEKLAPLMIKNTQFCFTNISKIEDYYWLSIVFKYLTFSSLLHSSLLFYRIAYLYPYQITDQKAELIDILFVIQNILRCNIDKRNFSLWIWSAIISDYEVMSVLESKCWDFIIFKNWTIISTNDDLNKYSVKQKWIFDSWVFKNQENKIDEIDFITRIFISKNKKGELFYFNFKEDEKNNKLIGKVCSFFFKKTNSFIFYLQRKLEFLNSSFNSFEYKNENNCINIQLNHNSDSYSLLIKVKQWDGTEKYSVKKLWRYIISTMFFNIF